MPETDKTLRLFVALELPEPLCGELATRAAVLRNALGDRALRWVPEPNRHVTLLFLGDTPAGAVDDIAMAMDRMAAVHAPFPLHLTSHGAFPRTAQPSVIWAGLDGGAALQVLAADLLKALGQEPDSKPFVPHLTLARIPARTGRQERRHIGSILQGLDAWETSDPEWAKIIRLYQSRLDASGAQYTRLHDAELTGQEKA